MKFIVEVAGTHYVVRAANQGAAIVQVLKLVDPKVLEAEDWLQIRVRGYVK